MSNRNNGLKKFTTTSANASSPVGLRFSSNSNSNSNNLSTIRGANSNNGLSELSEFNRAEEFELAPANGVLNNMSNNGRSNNGTTYNGNNGNSYNENSKNESTYNINNGNSNNGTTKNGSRNSFNQVPRITRTNMGEYPPLGGKKFSNNKTSKKPGKRNNAKSRKSRKTRKTKSKNRK